MNLTEVAKLLNERFGAVTGSQSVDFLSWDWDGWAAAYGKRLPAMLEDVLYTLVFNADRFAYRVFDVLASRPGEETTAVLLATMKQHRKGQIRALAARKLGELKEPSAVNAMVRILTDMVGRFPKQLTAVDGLYASEYAEMIDALAEIGAADEAEWILSRLADGVSIDRGLRARSEEALRKLGKR